jgi:hypothetical protein
LGVQASELLAAILPAFPAAAMSDQATRLALSPLPPMSSWLVEHGVRDEDLTEAVDNADSYAEVAPAVVDALGRALDEWLEYSNTKRYEKDAFTEPYVYLAMTEHIEVVQAFRDLLNPSY